MSEKESEGWKKKFGEATGQYAFMLALSRRQIDMLGAIYTAECMDLDFDRKGWLIIARGGTHNVTTAHALQRRGLLTGPLELSPAGRSVCEMLVHAGLVEKPEAKSAAA